MEAFISTPQLTVLSGPMGGGKSGGNTAIINGLRDADMRTWGMERVMSISETDRGRREEMNEPKDAYVFNQPVGRFTEALRTGDIMEMVFHSGTHYGSPTPAEGVPTHLEVEVTGTHQIITSSHPRVVAARLGIRCAYLLQSSMQDLFEQIMDRKDGMTRAKKLERISRYPSEVLYIIENELPYVFVHNEAGNPDVAQEQLVKYMLGDPSARLETLDEAEKKAQEATLWLARRGLDPVAIKLAA